MVWRNESVSQGWVGGVMVGVLCVCVGVIQCWLVQKVNSHCLLLPVVGCCVWLPHGCTTIYNFGDINVAAAAASSGCGTMCRA
jgi:hypothetical protein